MANNVRFIFQLSKGHFYFKANLIWSACTTLSPQPSHRTNTLLTLINNVKLASIILSNEIQNMTTQLSNLLPAHSFAESLLFYVSVRAHAHILKFHSILSDIPWIFHDMHTAKTALSILGQSRKQGPCSGTPELGRQKGQLPPLPFAGRGKRGKSAL